MQVSPPSVKRDVRKLESLGLNHPHPKRACPRSIAKQGISSRARTSNSTRKLFDKTDVTAAMPIDLKWQSRFLTGKILDRKNTVPETVSPELFSNPKSRRTVV